VAESWAQSSKRCLRRPFLHYLPLEPEFSQIAVVIPAPILLADCGVDCIEHRLLRIGCLDVLVLLVGQEQPAPAEDAALCRLSDYPGRRRRYLTSDMMAAEPADRRRRDRGAAEPEDLDA
jgi:hypothetical protein